MVVEELVILTYCHRENGVLALRQQQLRSAGGGQPRHLAARIGASAAARRLPRWMPATRGCARPELAVRPYSDPIFLV